MLFRSVDLGADLLEVHVLGPDGQELAKGERGKDGLVARLAAAPEDGTYVVQVRGGIDTEADYELNVQLLPPCRERDDRFEDNDQAVAGNPLDAQLMSQPLAPLQLCPGDDDWYAVQLKEGESLFVDLQAPVDELPDAAALAGQLTVEVWDDQGTRWGEAIGGPVQGGAIVRTAVVLAPPPGTYRVRVTGGGVAAPTFPLPEVPQTPPGPSMTRRVSVKPSPSRSASRRNGADGHGPWTKGSSVAGPICSPAMRARSASVSWAR